MTDGSSEDSQWRVKRGGDLPSVPALETSIIDKRRLRKEVSTVSSAKACKVLALLAEGAVTSLPNTVVKRGQRSASGCFTS